MDKKGFHSIRRAAVTAAVLNKDYTALAAVVSGGDQLYMSQDWDTWEQNDRVVFGMLTALSFNIEREAAAKVAPMTMVWELAVAMVGERTVREIAQRVWEGF
jgi:hypothetical protein